jgi:DNA-binding Lrp family transcriptional regulator
MQGTQPRTHKTAAEKLPGPAAKHPNAVPLRNIVSRGSVPQYLAECSSPSGTKSRGLSANPVRGVARFARNRDVLRCTTPLSIFRRLFVPAELDAIDWRILKELQDDGRITNVELARRVGISAPPSLRRVRALEEAGFIKGYRALLDEKQLGYEVTVFAMVHLASQAEADLAAFEAFVRSAPLVRECWMLSGEIDFLLKCVAPDLRTFQAFVTELTAAPHVRNVKTSLTLRNSKDAPMVPLEMRSRS